MVSEPFDLTEAAQLAEFEDPPSGHRQHFTATTLIRALLVSHISATTELSTHLHLSRQVVSRCIQTFEVIHQLMTVSSQPGTRLNWDVFDAYTRAIPILESILLSFETPDSYTQQKHLPDDDDILGALRFISLWEQEKIQLVEILQGLASDEFLGLWERSESVVGANTSEFLRNTRLLLRSTPFAEIARDDLTTLAAVWDLFETLSSDSSLYDAVPKNIATHIRDTMHRISLSLKFQNLVDQNSQVDIQQAFSSPQYMFAQIFTKSLMLITIPFTLLSNFRPNPKPLDDNMKKHLSHEGIWKEMRGLAEMLLGALDDKRQQNDLKPFEDKYTHLRKLLLSNLPTPSDLVDETLKLLRLSAQIFRRFQQRSVALIRLLHFLEQESSTKTVPLGARDEVRIVFQEAIRLLEVTEEKFRGRSLKASVTKEEYDERATAFEELFLKLRKCGKLLDSSDLWLSKSNLWVSKETDFLTAVELDETHMKEQELFT